MFTVFDISFGEAWDNSNNALPPSLNLPSSAPPSGITPYSVKANIGFYEKKKAQQLFSLQSNERMTSNDIINITNSYVEIKKLGQSSIYDISKGPHSGATANITTITTETALVENLRLQDTEEKNVRKILCIDSSGIPLGPNGETRYDVFYMDSRNLDVSGAPNAGALRFSLLNAVSGGPAPKDADIVDTSSAFIGSVSKYTLSTDISAGQPVCVDISSNGPICAKACDSNTLIQDILGIAVETKLENEEVVILSNGYITAKRETVFDTKPRMADLLMGVDSDEHGDSNGSTSWAISPVRSNNGTITRTNAGDPITVTGPIKFLDDGGSLSYSNGRNIREEFDAGDGNTFLMKVNNFRFETPGVTSGSQLQYYDWLRIQYSDDNTTWRNLNQRIAPEISKQLYYVDNDNLSSPVSIFSEDLGGNDSSGIGADEGSYFPYQYTTSAKNVLQNFNEINARYIRFIFHSDGDGSNTGWDIELDNSVKPGLQTSLLPNQIGSPLYLNNDNYSEVTENDTSGNVLVGYIAGTDVSDNGIYMRTLSFPQSSSAFSRIITTAPTAAGIMGEIRFNTSNNKMYIWNGSAWRVVDTAAS